MLYTDDNEEEYGTDEEENGSFEGSSFQDGEEEEERSYFEVADVSEVLRMDSACHRLSKLTIFGCGIVSLRGLPLSERLRYLNVSSNELGPNLLCPELSSLPNLEELDASCNRLSKICGSGSASSCRLPSLKKLVVAYNRFASLKGISQKTFPKLDLVDARNNILVERPRMKAIALLDGNLKLEARDDLAELRAKTVTLEAAVADLSMRNSRRLATVFVGTSLAFGHVIQMAKSKSRFQRWRMMSDVQSDREAMAAAHQRLLDIERDKHQRECEKQRDEHGSVIDKLRDEHRLDLQKCTEQVRQVEDAKLQAAEAAASHERDRVVAEHQAMIEKLQAEGQEAVRRRLETERLEQADRLDELRLQRNDERVAIWAAHDAALAMLRCELTGHFQQKLDELIVNADRHAAAAAASATRDVSARVQLAELRNAFERAAVAAAEGKARAGAATSAHAEMSRQLAEAAEVARSQRTALNRARTTRDEVRRELGMAREDYARVQERCRELQDVVEHLTSDAERRVEETRQVARSAQARLDHALVTIESTKRQTEDMRRASNAAFAALAYEHRTNTRRLMVATDSAEAARDEAARRDSLATELSDKLTRARNDYRDLNEEIHRLRSSRDALAKDRNLLRSELDKVDARLKAQLQIEQHLRAVVAELRKYRHRKAATSHEPRVNLDSMPSNEHHGSDLPMPETDTRRLETASFYEGGTTSLSRRPAPPSYPDSNRDDKESGHHEFDDFQPDESRSDHQL